MTRPTILVTGATGKTGGAVTRQLLEDGWPVRALVHTEDVRSEELRRCGAEVVVADMFDAKQLQVALRGVQRAYYVTLFKPGLSQAA
jgi:NAD(P)H dehydrogenase (quinone)